MPNKNYRKGHGKPKGFSSLLRTKISNKKVCQTKDLTKRKKKIDQEFKTYKNNQFTTYLV